MRIAFITPEFVTEEYFSGGLANYVNRVTQALASMGHDVHVITLSSIDEDDFAENGVCIHRVKVKSVSLWFQRLTRRRLKRTGNCLKFSYFAYRKLQQLHREKPFELIQSSNYQACGLFAKLLLRVPHVARLSSYRPASNELSGVRRNLDKKAMEWLEGLHLRLCRHIYAPSFTLQRVLHEKTTVRGVEVIRSPFFMETPHQDTSVYEEHLRGKDYLLFFGRLQMHKGAHILGQALPRVFACCPNLYAAFVGLDSSSPLGPSMREYIRSLAGENAERLVFIDQTPHTQLYPIISRARLVVLPSLIDNLPNTCLEAMALGKPIVGTIGASFDEVLEDGKTGFLVQIGDKDALAEKIVSAWHHPNLNQIGEAARCRIEEFAPQRTVKALVQYYERIV
jgi:glycosyltransferase involved in cell wall biosynthesis